MNSDKKDFDPDELISQTIRFLERKKKEYVETVIEETEEAPHTNPNYADIDVYIGSNSYYNTIREAVHDMDLGVESYDDLSYSNFLAVMMRHYLMQRLGDTDIRLWTEQDQAYYPMPHLIKKLDEQGVDWMDTDDDWAIGRGGKTGVWMYFFPEEEVDSLVRKIKLDIAERGSCPQEFREALSEFPKVLNNHSMHGRRDWNSFHATLNHEFTHNYLHRNSTAKKLGMEFIDSLDEATCQFISKYIRMKQKTNRESALNFHSSPDSYGAYGNPEEVHYFVEIIRENVRYARENEARLNVIDHVRQNTLRFFQDGGEKEDFLKQLTPQNFQIPIHRLERADEGISHKLERMKEDLQYIQRNIRDEPENVKQEFEEIKQDFSQIKSPQQIKKEVMEQAYHKMIEEQKDYVFLGSFIEKELKKEIEEFLDSQQHIKQMENILNKNRRIEDQMKRLEDLNNQIQASEEEFKSILQDLERRTS
ncbi:hypothetical protein ACK3SF_03090 [Candidatus Nanosalina sp. VS9-1]|uniref:hypothetical protein n=1 Tax=Candidatus Nanosalina sp. VS9-1 TaxID=3388566 RepID=UPI0039DF8173